MVSSAEKYVREIEIFTLSRGVGAEISRRYVQKGVYSGQHGVRLEKPSVSKEAAVFFLPQLAETG